MPVTTDGKRDDCYEELQCVFDPFPKYHINILLGDCNAKREKRYFQTNSRKREFTWN